MILCYKITIKDGSTALHWATWNNSTECLALLLSHGADVNVKDNVSNIDNMS